MPEPPAPGGAPIGRRALLLAPFGAAAAAGLAFWAMLRGMPSGRFDPRAVPSPLIGRAPPAFALPGPDGGALDAAGLRAPVRPILVNFFASWCLPCREEADVLAALAGDGVPIWGIAYKDRPDAIAGFLKRSRNPYARLGYDTAGETAIDWGVTGVPETFAIDRAGIVRWHYAGPLPDSLLSAVRRLAA